MNQRKVILWDFDGVILDSMEIRDWGFREIFKDFPSDKRELLIEYHRENGGLSRFVKIKHFYENILKQSITEKEIQLYAKKFSDLMIVALVNPQNLIQETVDFIRSFHDQYRFHIVSGSAQDELRFLCKELGIDIYFHSVYGSPTPKINLVAQVLTENSYEKENCCLIGDSFNDFEAAQANAIRFFGFNNPRLNTNHYDYIKSFQDFKF